MEEADILSGHLAATRTRYDDCTGPILLIQDTTEFSYQRANTSAIGLTKSVAREMAGQQITTAFLAFSETWIRG